MGDRCEKSDGVLEIFSIIAAMSYGRAVSESLPYDGIKLNKYLFLEKKFLHGSDIGSFVEVDLRYPNKIKGKTKSFPICPENKVSTRDKFSDHVNEMDPKNY